MFNMYYIPTQNVSSHHKSLSQRESEIKSQYLIFILEDLNCIMSTLIDIALSFCELIRISYINHWLRRS